MFRPRLALASLSGQSDAAWARAGADTAGAAILGGIALCEPSRAAARDLVARGRTEFLPPDPVAFVDEQFARLDAVPIRPGINVRTTSAEPIRAVGRVCRAHNGLLEINAHCRQDELCAVGCGETLLCEPSRLCAYVAAGVETGATVGVKMRAEVTGVDLAELIQAIEGAGATYVHLDAMDSPESVQTVAGAGDCFVIANNGVRDVDTVETYASKGADAVSIGRPSDDPAVRRRVARAVRDRLEQKLPAD